MKCSAVKEGKSGRTVKGIMVGEVKRSEVKGSAVKGVNRGVP